MALIRRTALADATLAVYDDSHLDQAGDVAKLVAAKLD